MVGVTFEQLDGRLTPEAKDLFRDMVAVHLAATGDRFFIESRTNRGVNLHFVGEGGRANLQRVDGGALADLAGYGVLQRTYTARGTANYRVGSDGIAFHQYLLEQDGAAVDQVENEVMRFVTGDAFAQEHPAAAQQLREAFDLLWAGRTDDQALSEVGGHLRHALFDVTSDLVGDDGKKQEHPIGRLRAWLAARSLPEREGAVLSSLIDLAERVLRLDQRLAHVRDQRDEGEPPVTWEEQRRAAFTTAFVCHELGRIGSVPR